MIVLRISVKCLFSTVLISAKVNYCYKSLQCRYVSPFPVVALCCATCCGIVLKVSIAFLIVEFKVFSRPIFSRSFKWLSVVICEIKRSRTLLL